MICSKIYDAVETHQLKQLVSLLKDGQGVNFFTTDRKCTPLHLACRYGFYEGVKALVNHGADVNSTLGYEKTPLLTAFECHDTIKRLAIITFLCDHGANIHATVGDRTALHEAASYNNVKVAKVLVGRGAKIHVKSKAKWTPFQHCYYESEVMYYFLSVDPSLIHELNLEGRAPIHMIRNPEILAYHLSRGANVHLRTIHGETPLHRRCYEDVDISLIRLFIKYGADVNAIDVDGQTPFSTVHNRCLSSAILQIIQLLLENGANPCIGRFYLIPMMPSLHRLRKVYKANACIQLFMCAKRKKKGILQQLPVDLIRLLHSFLR